METRSLYVSEKRKEIAAYLSDTTPQMLKLVSHPIKARAVQIPYAVHKVLVLIANMDPKVSIPIMIVILENMLQKTKHYSYTEQHLASANYILKVLNNADEMQYKSVAELLSFLGNISKIKADLADLVKACQCIQVTEDNVQLCRELMLTLEGLYLHTYKSKDSFDIENKALSYATNGQLTKMIIANHYHLSALEIELLISQFEKKLIDASLEKSIVFTSQNTINYDKKINEQALPKENEELETINQLSPTELLSNEITANQVNVVDDKKLQQILIDDKNVRLFKEADGFHLAISLEREPLLKEIEYFLKNKIQEDANFNIEELFWQVLNRVSQDSDEKKINGLFQAIEKYGLTARQQDRLLYLKNKTIQSLHDYKSNTTLKWFLGSISDYLFPRTHKEMAEATIKEIEKEENPKHILSILFALHMMLSDKLSKQLLGMTKRLLLDAYTMLWKYHLTPAQSPSLYVPASYLPTLFATPSYLPQDTLAGQIVVPAQIPR